MLVLTGYIIPESDSEDLRQLAHQQHAPGARGRRPRHPGTRSPGDPRRGFRRIIRFATAGLPGRRQGSRRCRPVAWRALWPATSIWPLAHAHEEFREARDRCPVLIFVQQGVEREPAQQKFVDEVGGWASGYYRASYTTPEELRDAVTRALHELELGIARGGADETELLSRAKELLPAGRGQAGQPRVCVVVAGGPPQSVLRPSEIGDSQLADWLLQQALFGPAPIFDRRQGNQSAVRGHALEIEQERGASLLLDERGTIRILQAARQEVDRVDRVGISSIIEEDVQERIERAIRFAGATLDYIDGPRRVSDTVVIVALLEAGYMPWRTRTGQAASPNQATMSSMGSRELVSVELAPARRPRAALLHQADRFAKDLTVLLARQLRP